LFNGVPLQGDRALYQPGDLIRQSKLRNGNVVWVGVTRNMQDRDSVARWVTSNKWRKAG